MIAKIQEHKLAIFFALLIFFLIYKYYTVFNPIILVNADDWRYFHAFSHPIPRHGWNITRILPEFSMPLTGYLSAFFIYPQVGDYLVSASISLAIVMAFSLLILFFVLYHLYYTLAKNRNIAVMVAVMTMSLFFALFKGNPAPADNVHMFSADQYNLYFFYVLPNILNSIIVLVFLRQIANKSSFSIFSYSTSGWMRGWLLVGLYFCIFSMLFSAAILLSFAITLIFYIFLYKLRSGGKLLSRIKDFIIYCIRDYNIAIIIILGTFVAMILESTSVRSNADSAYGPHFQETYFGSLFSIEFLRRIGNSAINLFSHISSVNKLVFLIVLLITMAAGILYFINRKSRTNLNITLAIKCFASAIFLFLFYIIIAAKAGPHYLSSIRCAYGVFFFLIICIGLLSIYILQEIKHSLILYPFITVIIIMVMLSSMWPYKSNNLSDKNDLVNSLINVIVEADELEYTEIELYIPNYEAPEYQFASTGYEWLANLLYSHKITSNRIKINEVKGSLNDEVYFLPK